MNERQACSLVEVLIDRASNRPGRVLYEFLDADLEVSEKLTFSELLLRARSIAAHLESEGLRGSTAVLLYPPGLAFIEAFFGCLAAGVIAVPVSPPDPVRLKRSLPRLRRIAENASVRAVLTVRQLVDLRERLFESDSDIDETSWVETDQIAAEPSPDLSPWRPAKEDTAFLQYTSGSTAEPRGVVVTHGNLMANERFIAEACGLSEEDRGVSWLPMVHDMGLIGSVLQPLYSGFPVRFLSPVAFLRNPLSWLLAISDFEATISPAPNFAYVYCIGRIPDDDVYMLDLSSWRCALNGAEPVNANILRGFQKKFAAAEFQSSAFYPCYGLAEATLLVSGAKTQGRSPSTVHLLRSSLSRGRAEVVSVSDRGRALDLVACGKPSHDHRVLIVDPETRVEKAEFEIGEIWVSGPSIAKGYWRNEGETEALFNAVLLPSGEGPFLRTGDLGFFVDGELVVTGRLKDLIIVRGKNHYPQDLETSAEKAHDSIVPGGVAAFALEEEGKERVAVAAELARRNLSPSEMQNVEEKIREAVTRDHEVTVHLVLLVVKRSLPKTSSGKLQRSTCRDRFLNGDLAVLHMGRLDGPKREGGRRVFTPDAERPIPSETEIRAWLLEQLARHIGIAPDEIDPGKSFDTFGLDSHDAVEIVDAAEIWLGREVDGALFYKYPTVDLLVRHLAKDRW